MNYSTMINQGISPILMKRSKSIQNLSQQHDKPVGRIYLVKASKMKWVFQFEIVSAHGVHCIGTQTGGFYRFSHTEDNLCATSVSRHFSNKIMTSF